MRGRPFCFCVLCAALGITLALACLFLVPSVSLADQPAASKPVSFINEVAPILKENCFACHDAKKRKGKLDMTTYGGLRKGGDKEDPIAPGKPDESHLLEVLTAKDNSRMPPKEAGDPLPKEKVALIERWIREGANLDSGLTAKSDLLRELRIRWQPPTPPAAFQYPININALAFTPDNQKLIVGGYHELTIWDAKEGKLEKRIRTRAERAYGMVFLPDGKLAVAGGRPGQEGDLRIYDLQGGEARTENGVAFLDGVNDKKVFIAELLSTDDAVLALALSPDGKQLACGGCDRLVQVWNLEKALTGAKPEQTIENHADWVFGVSFSPDGKRLLTVSRDKTAKVWDLAAKESVMTFPDHQNAVYGVAVRPDGKQGLSVGEDNNLRFWNAASDGKQVRAASGHGKAVFKVLTHPKQPLALTCSADGTVRLWNLDSGKMLQNMTGHTDFVYALAISPDGELAASGSWNGEVRIWKLPDGKLVKAFNATPGLAATAAAAQTK